ncbi:MAG: TetR/AcrR family transcriptional regulator [Myxococcales bacterium]
MSEKRATPQKRLAILDAAARAISEHGFHGMSLRALAAATGQSLANFYNYFESKEAVLYEIQRSAFESMIAATRKAVDQAAAPQDKLYAFLLQHVRYVADHRDAMRVLVHEARALPRDKRSAVRRLKERYYEIVREIVADIYRAGCGAPDASGTEPAAPELEHLTYAVFGMVNWLYGWYVPSRHGAPAEVASSLHSLVLCGLVTRCPRRVSKRRTVVDRRLSLAPPPLLGLRAVAR